MQRFFAGLLLSATLAGSMTSAQAGNAAPPEAPLPPDLTAHATTATAPPPPSGYEFDALRHQIGRVMDIYRRRPLNTLEHNPWEVMHWSLTWALARRSGRAPAKVISWAPSRGSIAADAATAR